MFGCDEVPDEVCAWERKWLLCLTTMAVMMTVRTVEGDGSLKALQHLQRKTPTNSSLLTLSSHAYIAFSCTLCMPTGCGLLQVVLLQTSAGPGNWRIFHHPVGCSSLIRSRLQCMHVLPWLLSPNQGIFILYLLFYHNLIIFYIELLV